MRGTYTRTEIDKYALTEIDQIARYAINTYIQLQAIYWIFHERDRYTLFDKDKYMGNI